MPHRPMTGAEPRRGQHRGAYEPACLGHRLWKQHVLAQSRRDRARQCASGAVRIADFDPLPLPTLHTSIRSVPDLLSQEGILSKICLIDGFLRDVSGRLPRIGVCAMNPHAGEEGLFGDKQAAVTNLKLAVSFADHWTEHVQAVFVAGVDTANPNSCAAERQRPIGADDGCPRETCSCF